MATDIPIQLNDGRCLMLRRYGDADRPAVILLHGTPGSRLVSANIVETFIQAGVQLITLDRPGYGRSDADFPRRLDRFAKDLNEVLHQLHLPRCVVAGVSGGGAHALALGAWGSAQIQAVYVLAGMVPTPFADMPKGPNRLPMRVMRFSPGLFRGLNWLMTNGAIKALQDSRKTERLLDKMKSRMPAEDRRRLEQPGAQEALVDNLREAFRQGGQATGEESLMLGRDWGFQLDEVTRPVHWWHGHDDKNVDFKGAQSCVQALPHGFWHPIAGGHAAWIEHLPHIVQSMKVSLS